MSITSCKNRWAVNNLLEPHIRCRVCSGCRLWLQQEWLSRMLLEAASNPSWPYFFTLTYNEENIPTIEEASSKARRFPQYVRRTGATIRYFICTELGDQNKRVHHHGVCWIPAWNRYTIRQILDKRAKVWPYGFSDFSLVRTVGAFRYVAKYIQKQDRFPSGVRGYQWSRRPELGARGVEAWRSALHNAGWTRGGDGGTSIGIRIPNRIKLNVLNKLTEIRIPDNDLRRLYSELGVPSQEPVLNGKILGAPDSCENYLRASHLIAHHHHSLVDHAEA